MKPFVPERLPIKRINWEKLTALIAEANALLAEYNTTLRRLPNPLLFFSPFSYGEAVLSSKIEGTITTIDEVLEYKALNSEKREGNDDIQEVINYRKALFDAMDWIMSGRPINEFMIRNVHKELLNSVRGKDKQPGKIRSEQNFIGKPVRR